MDTLRGHFGSHDADESGLLNEAVHDAPPVIGSDERRMQVRAYNFWASLLDNRNFPGVEDLHPEDLPDFGPHGVLLDFSTGIDDPAVAFIGDRLAAECDAGHAKASGNIRRLSDVPSRSLLSRITDHYMQILANQAPIGFEAEFVTPRGTTVLYRGILLPFSSNDETIDFIFGVINWKELADARTADELLLEIDQALELPRNRPERPMADWADGPSADGPVAADSPPVPSFGLLDDSAEAESILPAVAPTLAPTASLADILAAARALAAEARTSEDRTRQALYQAIGRAHDFALAAATAPEDFAELVADAGLAVQDRAPMTPVVKLVFGADYDKTRLTEYAATLLHAQRLGLPQGALAGYLRSVPGGLKGVVAEERRLRRADDDGSPLARHLNAFQALRKLDPVALDQLDREGEEFALVMVRRTGGGEVVVLGEVPADAGLVERAARKLVG